jgi:hypothetical protein
MHLTIRRGAAALALLATALLPATLRAQDSVSHRIINGSALPRTASDLRDQGTPAYDVEGALRALQAQGVSAEDAAHLFEAEFRARATQPKPPRSLTDRVRYYLEKGLRGTALATAVAEERKVPADAIREVH